MLTPTVLTETTVICRTQSCNFPFKRHPCIKVSFRPFECRQKGFWLSEPPLNKRSLAIWETFSTLAKTSCQYQKCVCWCQRCIKAVVSKSIQGDPNIVHGLYWNPSPIVITIAIPIHTNVITIIMVVLIIIMIIMVLNVDCVISWSPSYTHYIYSVFPGWMCWSSSFRPLPKCECHL